MRQADLCSVASGSIIRFCRRQGLRIAVALAPPSAGACRTGSVILTAKLTAGHDAEGKRREPPPGRSGCRQCPRSGIPGRRWAPTPDHPVSRNPASGHARDRHGGTGRRGPGRQGAGGCGRPERPSSYSGITLSDEGGQGKRTGTRRYGARPGRRGWLCEPHANGHSVAPANPAGVLEMLAWSPAVQKAAGLLSRSCRNRREQDPDVAGNVSSPSLKVDNTFLEIYC